MTNIRNMIILVACMLAMIFAAGCNHSSNPVTPGRGNRSSQEFDNNNTNAIFTTASGTYATVDMATPGIYRPPQNNPPPQPPTPLSGDPAIIGGTHHTIAVSLLHDSSLGDVIHYAWLQDSNTTPEATGTIGSASGSGVYYAFPKVSALYVGNQAAGYGVYVAVAYMRKTTGGDWDIALWIGNWDQTSFPTGAPSVQFNQTLTESNDQSYPDLAFDFDQTGSLYVCFTDYFSAYNPYPNQLCYRQFTRNGTSWLYTNPQIVSRINDSNVWHDCWMPRIDVG